MKQSCSSLLEDYRVKEKIGNPRKILFEGIGNFDVYNPTVPFVYKDKTYIIGRVEKRDSENSEAVFFEKIGNYTYKEDKTKERYTLQDPFVSYISNKWILGGTEIFVNPKDNKNLWWKTAFYWGDDLDNLELLTYGPDGMKDIRLVELKDKRIGVFTRPQGELGGRGKIGFTIIDSLEELSSTVINKAFLLDHFFDDEWSGVNQAILLDDGKIGVIGHIAKFSDDGIRHYYSMAFTLDFNNKHCSKIKVIAERSDFLPSEAKRADLIDVLFSAGIINVNNKMILYTGVNDIEVQAKQIANPFK